MAVSFTTMVQNSFGPDYRTTAPAHFEPKVEAVFATRPIV